MEGTMGEPVNDIHDSPAAPLELKGVDVVGRIVEGYCSVFDVVDRQGDLVPRTAFARTLAERKLGEISVFVGHRTDRLPVGRPLHIAADEYGLFTRTRIFATQAGTDLLTTAKELLQAGGTLGMSMGYRARDYEWKRGADGAPIRILRDVDLHEYSFLASPALAANAFATVMAVKRRPRTVAEYQAELDEAGRWLDAQKWREWQDARMRREQALARLEALMDPDERHRAREEESQRKAARLVELVDLYGMDRYDELRKIAGFL
jgi:uncharacterized protein